MNNFILHFNSSVDPRATLNALPGLYVINRFYPTILFSIEMQNTEYDDHNDNRKLGITFFNTSAVKDIRSLCTCICYLDGMLQRVAEVKSEESWTEENISWQARQNVDQ